MKRFAENKLKKIFNFDNYTIYWELHENKLSVEYETLDRDGCLFLQGFVKWDGCSNWNWMPDNCMFHACTQKGLLILAEIPMFCWVHASMIIESFEGGLE